MAHGQYPESLDMLITQYIEKLPHDVIGGGPMIYRRVSEGEFLLYSVGWNGKDDGGVAAFKTDGTVDMENGDWVWPQLQR